MKKSTRNTKPMPQRNQGHAGMWRKHNYNPMGGCLLVFVQLPIFMGCIGPDGQRRASAGVAVGEAVRVVLESRRPTCFGIGRNVMRRSCRGRTAWLGRILEFSLMGVGLFVWQHRCSWAAGRPTNKRGCRLCSQLCTSVLRWMGN